MSHAVDEEYFNRSLIRSNKGGEHATLGKVVKFLMEKSGHAYADCCEADARRLRDLAHVFRGWQNEAAKELDELNKELNA
jgi:hypothetical protein